MALEVKIIQLHINRRSGVYLIDQADWSLTQTWFSFKRYFQDRRIIFYYEVKCMLVGTVLNQPVIMSSNELLAH